jgi:hypothetical protein
LYILYGLIPIFAGFTRLQENSVAKTKHFSVAIGQPEDPNKQKRKKIFKTTVATDDSQAVLSVFLKFIPFFAVKWVDLYPTEFLIMWPFHQEMQ